jgi:hypothetical protein
MCVNYAKYPAHSVCRCNRMSARHAALKGEGSKKRWSSEISCKASAVVARRTDICITLGDALPLSGARFLHHRCRPSDHFDQDFGRSVRRIPSQPVATVCIFCNSPLQFQSPAKRVSQEIPHTPPVRLSMIPRWKALCWLADLSPRPPGEGYGEGPVI